jgi:cell division protein FtsW
MNDRIKVSKRIDFFLLICVLFLVVFGVVMVFSASFYSSLRTDDDPYGFLIPAAMWALGGLVLMTVLYFVPYKVYSRLALPGMFIAIVLLIALYTPLGVEINGAVRWIRIGPVTIMPGEICKICAIWFVAWFYSKNKRNTRSFSRGFLPPVIVMAICFVLIYKQPNLSTAITVCGVIIAMMFISGTNLFYLIVAAGAGIGGVVLMIFANPESEHFSRFTGFLNPFADTQNDFYQTVQGLLALGAGGVHGVGPGNSIQKALYLPYAQNDFIFAIIGEEFGFIGCIFIMLVFLVLIWRCTLIAINAPDRFSMLLAAGITVLVALQVILNIAVVTSVIPPTGITLPFISYGGNAMLLFTGAMGIMLNISKNTEHVLADGAKPKPKQKKKSGSGLRSKSKSRPDSDSELRKRIVAAEEIA